MSSDKHEQVTEIVPQQVTSLPVFPSFVALTADHQAIVNEIIKSDPLYSDYNFISLWSWDHQNKLKLCTLNNNLVIRFQNYLEEDDFYYSFWGKNSIDSTTSTLLDHSMSEGKPELKLIPEFVAMNIKNKSKFVVKEDRDSFDYIVAVSDNAELKEKRNSSKRHTLNKFIKEHGDKITIKELDINDSKSSDEIENVVKAWLSMLGSDKSYNSSELEAINKILKEFNHIKTERLHIVGLYIDNSLKAFSINELLDGGFAMGHYKKADRTYKGLGVALDHFTAKKLQEKGVLHLNHEQDLGIEGLRQAKMASHPVYFLKKYTVSLAEK